MVLTTPRVQKEAAAFGGQIQALTAALLCLAEVLEEQGAMPRGAYRARLQGLWDDMSDTDAQSGGGALIQCLVNNLAPLPSLKTKGR